MNAWDFDRAAQNFMQLKEQGKIPAEAFVGSPQTWAVGAIWKSVLSADCT